MTLKQRLAGLSADQRALLIRRLGKAQSEADASDGSHAAIPRARPLRVEEHPRVAVYPASSGQQRMWFLHHYAPESSVYCVPSAFHLVGPLNVAWLQLAFGQVIRRHDMLRTTFAMEDGKLLQRVAGSTDFQLQSIRLEETPADIRKAAAERCLDEETCRPFDLAAGPPFRAVLLRLQPDEHMLLLVLHHILSDGWSRSNFYRELSTEYEAMATGRPAPVRVLPVQFADYSAWRQDWLEDGALEAQTAYWKSKLAGELEPLDLPSDRARPATVSYRGGRCSRRLDPHLVAALKTRAQEEGATLFMILLAAFKTLLHRYTGNDDLIVGVPIANRQRAEVEGLIGFFANTLVLRTAFADDPTFRALLRRVKECAVEAYANQDMPFERLVELLHVRRDVSRPPLFQTTFALQDFPAALFSLPGIQTEPWFVTTHTAKFDFSLSLEPSVEGWTAKAEYSTDLFEADRVERMLDHWRVILEAIVSDPSKRVSEIPLLTATERHQILVEWNQTERDYPRDKCVHQLFEEQVERTPEGVAVVFEGQSLTYRELNARANQLAHHLRSLGVGPDVLVGLCVERSLEMVVALLGILKAGGAYVPLDLKYPKERIEFILRDAAARVLVTQRSLNFGQDVAHPVYLDDVIPQDAASPGDVRVTPASLAYVIYTSGSTGKPKGVGIEHHSPVSFLHWIRDSFSDAELSGVLASTSICFDLSVFEIFGPLSWGGRVLLANSALDLGLPSAPKDVVLINTVPSVLAELLQERGLPPSVRTVNLAGEPLRQALVEAIFKKTSAERVNDLYGPSETTIYSTWARRKAGGIETIGHPIANTQIYILDRYGQPMPVGISGELHIGGAGVARGYWHRPELTAERFVTDPFGDGPGRRLFKTGDRGRWRADGQIEFLGREDQQVKIRGFRIELAEIEIVLAGHPDVAGCSVLTQNLEGGDRTLTAFVVGREKAGISVGSLRQWLGEQLPDFMIPSRFFVLPALPLTPNGKVDRTALGKLDGLELAPGATYTAPRNELERALVEIWQRLLRREHVGIHDNFFSLGGHSLLAARLTTEIDKLLRCNLPISALFQSPTVESLTRRLTLEKWAPPWSSLVPLQPLGANPPLFLAHGWGGDVFVFLGLAQQLAPDQPVYGLQAVGLDGQSPRHTSIEEMATHYVQEIRSFQPTGPYYLGGYSMGGLIAFEMAQQLHRVGQRVALLALFDTQPICGIPSIVFGRILVSYLPGRFMLHLRRWWNMPRGQKGDYLRGRWGALKVWTARNRSKMPVMIPPPPACTQPPHMSASADYYPALALKYRLHRYPGSASVFVSNDSNPKWISSWKYLVRDGSFHQVPGTHLQLLTPLYLPELVKDLRTAIHRAQKNARKGSGNEL